MKLKIIETGYFKLDGGAMFGVVPKQIWKHLNPPDDNNMCTWSMRCLLVEHKGRIIVFDTGMGNKQDDKFRSYFEPHGDDTLISSIRQAGYDPSDITDVFQTHFHFDHVGGSLLKNQKGEIEPAFPNATYWSNKLHYDWAADPNAREKASFLAENFKPLNEMGLMQFIDLEDGIEFMEDITVDFYYGHTEAMMVPTIHLPDGKKLVFTADLLPSAHHVRMPYVMSYDIRPLETLNDRKRFYEKALDPDCYLFFEHDKDTVLGQLVKDEKGRFEITEADTSLLF
ncbi:MAG: MBL fold metallo-hydrolase [Saprospiraceae bacterium]